MYSTVTGEPFNDPRGRWRVGGGVNIPVALDVVIPAVTARAFITDLRTVPPNRE